MADKMRIIQIVACVINALLFIVTAIFNATFGAQMGSSSRNASGNSGQLQNYQVDIVPASWAFSIWGLIYTWQAVWIIYSIVNLFRGPQITRLIPLSFIITYMGSHVFNSTWIYVAAIADSKKVYLPVSAVVLWAIYGFLLAAIILLSLDLPHKHKLLMKNGYRFDIWLVRFLVQNGIGIYLAWCSVAAPLNTAISLAHFHGLKVPIAGTVALGIVAFELVLFVPTDLIFLDRWTRYLITPHLTLIWALMASLIRNKVTKKANSVFTLVLLSLCIVATVLKVVVMLWRHLKDSKKGSGKVSDSEANLKNLHFKRPEDITVSEAPLPEKKEVL